MIWYFISMVSLHEVGAEQHYQQGTLCISYNIALTHDIENRILEKERFNWIYLYIVLNVLIHRKALESRAMLTGFWRRIWLRRFPDPYSQVPRKLRLCLSCDRTYFTQRLTTALNRGSSPYWIMANKINPVSYKLLTLGDSRKLWAHLMSDFMNPPWKRSSL